MTEAQMNTETTTAVDARTPPEPNPGTVTKRNLVLVRNDTPPTGLELADSAIIQLVKGLGEIEALVRTIRDIATKTDLLALNASIEAARAGQAGKGFAIVADEVGRLSDKVQITMNSVETVCAHLRTSADDIVEGVKKAKTHAPT